MLINLNLDFFFFAFETTFLKEIWKSDVFLLFISIIFIIRKAWIAIFKTFIKSLSVSNASFLCAANTEKKTVPQKNVKEQIIFHLQLYRENPANILTGVVVVSFYIIYNIFFINNMTI